MSEESANKKGFMKWLRGSSRQEYIENLSYVVMFLSAFFIFIGLGLGSFVTFVVYIAVLGSFLLLIGIVLYILSQLIEKRSTDSVESLVRSSGEN